MKIDRRDFLRLTSAATLSSALSAVAESQSSAQQPTPTGKSVAIYTTAENSEHRISQTGTTAFQDFGQPLETQICVFVDPTKKFQTHLGIGGALTDAAAETLAKLPAAKQDEVIRAYYDPQHGIGYTLGRTNIHSCDFSSASYTYVKEGDAELASFSIDHDKQYRLPLIKRAIAAAGGKLTLFASPWSPPAFMKSNGDMLHGGKLKPEFYQAWANYYVKFIKAYEQAGIPIWGITVQNEPMATQTWESCIYSAEEERDFVKKYLGPTMKKAGLGKTKIIAWDHNRDLMYQRASTVLNDPEAAKYIWGIGFHWYESWAGGEPMFDNVRRVHESFPDKPLLFTEATHGPFDMAKVRDWKWGEEYARAIIHDFNNGTAGWTDWNILLDETGGPNHVQNFCFAPVIADTRSGELIYMNSYYYLGHFSKFIRPGAKRIECSPSRSALEATAFVNPDESIVAVVLNRTEKEIPYYLWMAGKAAEVKSLPHSIQTLNIWGG
jgi:glucosylceramidase